MMIKSDDLGNRIRLLRDGGLPVVLDDVLLALEQCSTDFKANFESLMTRVELAARRRIAAATS